MKMDPGKERDREQQFEQFVNCCRDSPKTKMTFMRSVKISVSKSYFFAKNGEFKLEFDRSPSNANQFVSCQDSMTHNTFMRNVKIFVDLKLYFFSFSSIKKRQSPKLKLFKVQTSECQKCANFAGSERSRTSFGVSAKSISFLLVGSQIVHQNLQSCHTLQECWREKANQFLL